MNITVIMGVVIAALVLTNGITGRLWLSARDDKVQAISDRDSARSAATACSDATEDLQALAARRAREAQPQLEAARSAQLAYEKAAKDLLARQPRSADTCEAASLQMDDWINGRRKP